MAEPLRSNHVDVAQDVEGGAIFADLLKKPLRTSTLGGADRSFYGIERTFARSMGEEMRLYYETVERSIQWRHRPVRFDDARSVCPICGDPRCLKSAREW